MAGEEDGLTGERVVPQPCEDIDAGRGAGAEVHVEESEVARQGVSAEVHHLVHRACQRDSVPQGRERGEPNGFRGRARPRSRASVAYLLSTRAKARAFARQKLRGKDSNLDYSVQSRASYH